MLRRVATGVLVAALSLAGLADSGQQATLVATRTQASLMAEANDALRTQIGQAMEQAARAMDLVLDTGDMVYVCRDDLIVASAGAAGFEDARSSTPMLHADVGLIYLSREVEVRFGDGEHGKRPPGFYVVRVALDQSRSTHDPGITLLELHTSSDTAALEFPTELLPPAAGRKLTASLELDADGGTDALCLGWHGLRFSVRICAVLVPAK